MKKTLNTVCDLAALYLKWTWPLLLADAALSAWAGESAALWRSLLNYAAFAWVLAAPLVPIRFLFDRERREAAMARLCGLREGDERERAVTGEAARATLLLGLSLQVVMLVLSLISVRLSYDPALPEGQKGLLQVGMGFDSGRHLDPFGAAPTPEGDRGRALDIGGYVLSPAAFPVMALLILAQLAAFKAFALRRYEGSDG
ncbi:MAG: hypothetical protein HYZ75_14365 [Elusimicrobia bacterium]|nr:hypothetical protein [Elusimicrobiota bacterium]